ncbi:hypothetical protein V6N11_006264 [Hibiscus sabdariffa]|uniref:Uncharacterized protein n=1 Tax=Hibiscus sabdariffa TaxID=183260 RepID=A0ABR2RR34_9ROSI
MCKRAGARGVVLFLGIFEGADDGVVVVDETDPYSSGKWKRQKADAAAFTPQIVVQGMTHCPADEEVAMAIG